MNKKILIIDDEPYIRDMLQIYLEKHDFNITIASSVKDGIKKINSEFFDIIIADMMLPDGSGIDILKLSKKLNPEEIFILVTAYSSVQSAMEAIKLGAYDYVTKPFKMEKLLHVLTNAIKEKQLSTENENLNRIIQKEHNENFIFVSKEMQQIATLIEKIAPTDVGPILIRGETGVGKGVVANLIHKLSLRKDKPFLEINCTSLQEKLLENELFGHEKGAFTDARDTKKGLFEIASEGTLFLDEIGDIELPVQAKLLKVLEDRSFFRLGGTKSIKTNTRIVSATNKNLEESIKEKTYREDLYYRLKMISFTIPPLRERKEDILHLIQFFMNIFNRKFKKKFTHVSKQAKEILLAYKWPGNVRELKNMLERIILLEDNEAIQIRHLPIEIFDTLLSSDLENITENQPAPEKNTASNDNNIDFIGLREGETPTLKEVEKIYIRKILESTNYNKTKTAQILGINRKTLWEKLKTMNI